LTILLKIRAEKKQNELKENLNNLIAKIDHHDKLTDELKKEKETTLVHGRKTRIEEELRLLRKEKREWTLDKVDFQKKIK
jgi:hypothetical protein